MRTSPRETCHACLEPKSVPVSIPPCLDRAAARPLRFSEIKPRSKPANHLAGKLANQLANNPNHSLNHQSN
jgi:hypothetical protein